MESIYFYVSGALTGILFVLFIYYFTKFNKLTKKMTEVLKTKHEQEKKLTRLIENNESKTRYADFLWEGWYNTKTPQEKYGVIFHLKQIARSDNNPNRFKFEVVSIISQQKNDHWGVKEYSDYFYKKHGGWLNISDYGKNFNWIIQKTKEELRDDKIDEILVDSLNEKTG